MSEDMAIYRRKLHQIYETVRPDELVQGWVTQDVIEVSAGEYQRGELMMSGEGGFVAATSEGLSSAEELCILCASNDVPEGTKWLCHGYFRGEFKASSVVLSWETSEDNHEELIEGIRETLRKHGIMLK